PSPASGATAAAAASAPAVDPELPVARNTEPLVDDATAVVVDAERILVDGVPVAFVGAVEAVGRAETIHGEFKALTDRRVAWEGAHPGNPFRGIALLRMHRATTALVAKSVFQTAAVSGYSGLAFAVEAEPATAGAPRIARVRVDAN